MYLERCGACPALVEGVLQPRRRLCRGRLRLKLLLELLGAGHCDAELASVLHCGIEVGQPLAQLRAAGFHGGGQRGGAESCEV